MKEPLRTTIEKIIEQYKSDPQQAATRVCFFLEDTLDLNGNGWWDNDADMLTAFASRPKLTTDMSPEEMAAIRRDWYYF